MKTKRKHLKTLVEMYSEQRLGDDSYHDDMIQPEMDDDTLEAEIEVLQRLADQKIDISTACEAFEKRCKRAKSGN